MTAQPTTAPVRANVARDTRNVLVRELKPVLRDPFTLIFSLLQPLVFLGLFAPLLIGESGQPAGETLQWFVPGVLVMIVLFGTGATGSNLQYEMMTGSHERTLVAPLARSSLLIGRALKEVAPVATPEACDALIGHLLPQVRWPREDWQDVHASARWWLWLPSLAWLLPVTALAAWHIGAWVWLPGLAWIMAAAYAARRQAQRMGWTLDDHLVAVRSGWWSRYWRFAEIDKLQALRLSRSPLDHRLRTATLWLDTAGASGLSAQLALRFVPEADAVAVHERLTHALAQRRLRW